MSDWVQEHTSRLTWCSAYVGEKETSQAVQQACDADTPVIMALREALGA